MNASNVEKTIEAVRNAFIAFLEARIERMGITESGAYNYYSNVRLKEGLILSDYEKALIAYLAARPYGPRWHLVHVGTGLGPLPLAVAALGHSVLAFEGDRKRYNGAYAARELLARQFPDIAPHYELRHGYYPDQLHDSDIHADATNILLFTNVASTHNRKYEDQLLESFPRFQEVVFNPGSFSENNPTAAKRDDLLQRASAHAHKTDILPLDEEDHTWYRLTMKSGCGSIAGAETPPAGQMFPHTSSVTRQRGSTSG